MSDLPPALQERIAIVEAESAGRDFDRRSVLVMLLLGVVLPVILIVLGAWCLP